MKPALLRRLNRRTFLQLGAVAGSTLSLSSQAADTARKAGKALLVPRGQDATGKTHPLGDRSFIDFKVTSAESNGDLLLIEHRELRKFGPPRHFHHAQDEWFYVLKGTYLIEVGGEKFRLGLGDMLFAPRKVPHVWMHVEEDPGSLLVAFEPAGKMEGFFDALVAEGALPTQDRQALFRAHGMEIVGPPLKA